MPAAINIAVPSAAAMLTGTVKWFDAKKGYGFITPDAGGADVFVHYSVISASGYKKLDDGQRVQFASAQDRKGARATRVIPL